MSINFVARERESHLALPPPQASRALIHGSTTCRFSSHGGHGGQRRWSYKLRTTNPTKPAARAIKNLSQNGRGMLRLYLPNHHTESPQVVWSAGPEINCTFVIKHVYRSCWTFEYDTYKCNHWEADGTKALVSNRDLSAHATYHRLYSNFVASVYMLWSMKSHLNCTVPN